MLIEKKYASHVDSLRDRLTTICKVMAIEESELFKEDILIQDSYKGRLSDGDWVDDGDVFYILCDIDEEKLTATWEQVTTRELDGIWYLDTEEGLIKATEVLGIDGVIVSREI